MTTADELKFSTPDQLRAFAREIERDAPSLKRRLCPRAYAHSDVWPSTKALLAMGAELVMQRRTHFALHGVTNRAALTAYYALARLADYETPTYFVAPEFMAAVSRTELPAGMTLRDLRWPFPAILFVLPKGVFPCGPLDTYYLGVAQNTADAPAVIDPAIEADAITLAPSRDGITTFAYVSHGAIFSWAHPLNDDPLDCGLSDPVFDTFMFDGTALQPFAREAVTDTDKLYTQQHIGLALRLLLALAARPDLVQDQTLLKRAKPARRGAEPKRDLWAPRILGAAYRVKRATPDAASAGTGPQKRAHWRRGFFRLLEPGEGRPWKQQKTIWIDPTYVVGAPE